MKRLAALLIALAGLAYSQVLDSEINLAQAARTLSENEAKIFPGSEIRTTPLNKGDTELVVGWRETSTDDWPELRAALEMYTWSTYMLQGQKSRFVDDPVIDGTPYPGRWRQARISRIRQEEQRDQFVYWIVLTLRSGYAEAISWDEARLREYRRSESVATALGTNVIANSTGLDPVQYAVIRFPNISPYKVNACIASLSAETYTNQSVYGETLSGEWYNLMVTGGKEDDGSGYVDLVLSRQRFTVDGYEFYNTVRQASLYRIFNVPKTIAQEIIDDWKGDGRSASATYNESTELCIVTLQDRDAVKDNLTLSWMYTGCDELFRQSFAWGYTKAEINTWVNDNFTNAPGTAPITRNLSVQDRGDGLFNAIMVERKFETLDATGPQISITLPIGTNITRQTDYGYNYNKTQLSSNAIQNQYDTTIAGVGTSVTFRVIREDDCSFDWQAEIVGQQSRILGDVDSGTEGVRSRAYSLRGARTSEVTTFEESVKSGPRTNVSFRIDMRDDGLADVYANMTVFPSNAVDLILSRLKPRWNSGGYSEDANVFDKVDSVSGIGGSEYGYFKELILNDDKTYSGTKVTVTYTNSAFGEAWPPVSEQGRTVNSLAWGGQFRWIRKSYTNAFGNSVYGWFKQTRKMYLHVPFTVTEQWYDDYTDAVTFINNGMQESRVSLEDVGGALKWKAEKWVMTTNNVTGLQWNAFGDWIETAEPKEFE